jgi:hypothetical protein
MERIETKEEKEKRQKRKARIFSFIMLAIMVLSTLGYAFITYEKDSSGSNKNAKGETQEQIGDSLWLLDYNGQQMTLSTSKEAAKNISVELFFDIKNYAGNQVYVSYENYSFVYYEISNTLGGYAKKVAPACLGKCEANLPEKNCTDLLIVYNKSDFNRVYQNENCVFIEGDIRAVDAFLYKIFSSK